MESLFIALDVIKGIDKVIPGFETNDFKGIDVLIPGFGTNVWQEKRNPSVRKYL